MNRSRSVSETSVGLFAFLDVLMSTMGSLILVLMVVTPKIRQEAVARTVRVIQQAKPSVARPRPLPVPVLAPRQTIDLNRKVQTEVAELSALVEGRRRAAAEKQVTLAAARSKLREADAKSQDLDRKLAQIRQEKDSAENTVAALSTEGIGIESRLATTRSRLRKIRGQIADESTKYTFVAYDGVSGTTRHPILLECTDEHIKFLQEDIALSSADVTGFTPAYNPVLAGAQALVEYWSTHSAPGDPKPYVLIVVRPRGTVAYYIVRRLLELMQDPFGYELLNDDQKLYVPPPVPEAVAACRAAIDKALSNRDGVFQQGIRSGDGRGTFGPRASGLGLEASGQSDRPKGRSASPFDDPDSSNTLLASKEAGQNPASHPSPENSGLIADKIDAAGGQSGGQAGTGGGRPDVLAGQAMPGGEPQARSEARAKPAAQIDAATGGPGAPGGPPGTENRTAAMPNDTLKEDSILKQGAFPGSASPGFPSPLTGPPTNSPSFTTMPSALSGGGQPSAPLESGQPSAPLGSGQPSAASGSNDPSAPSGSNQPATEPGGQTQSSSAGGQMANSMDSEARPSALPAATGSDAPSGLPNFTGSGETAQGARSASSAKRQWGVSGPGANIGFERDVTVQVGAERIVVGEQPAILCGKAETSEGLSAAVIQSLQRDARSWGKPPDNFYWVPNIKFIISPGGNIQYERIRKAMARHGLISSVDFRLDAVKPRAPGQSMLPGVRWE